MVPPTPPTAHAQRREKEREGGGGGGSEGVGDHRRRSHVLRFCVMSSDGDSRRKTNLRLWRLGLVRGLLHEG